LPLYTTAHACTQQTKAHTHTPHARACAHTHTHIHTTHASTLAPIHNSTRVHATNKGTHTHTHHTRTRAHTHTRANAGGYESNHQSRQRGTQPVIFGISVSHTKSPYSCRGGPVREISNNAYTWTHICAENNTCSC